MATNESNVVHVLQVQRHYDVFHWVPPSSEFIAANDITDFFMVYLRTIDTWRATCSEYEKTNTSNTSEWGEGEEHDDEEEDSITGEWQQERQCKGGDNDGGEVEETLFMTLQMMHMEQPITPLLESSHTHGDTGTFDEWIIFPIAIRDIPLDAAVHCCVYSCSDGLIGRTTFHPFTACGRLKAGLRRYQLHRDAGAGPEKIETPAWELLARDLHDGLMQSVPWMDKLVERRLVEMRKAQDDESDAAFTAVKKKKKSASPTISLFFPFVRHRSPVFLLSVPHGVVAGMSSSASSTTSFPLAATPMRPYPDMCLGDENICEAKAHALSKSLFLFSDANANAQPGPLERRQLQEILRRPMIHLEQLKVEEEMLLWRFRFFLSRDPAYFVLFVRCVNWKNTAERQKALEVMHQWKPISFSQALVCLSFYFRDVIQVRRYAISVLDGNPVEYILRFLLQLVQGARYDVKDELEQFLIRRALNCWELCSTLFWYIHVETSLETSDDDDTITATNDNNTDQHLRGGKKGGRYAAFLQHLLTALEKEKPHFLQCIRRQQKLVGVLRSLYRTILKDPRDRVRRMELATSLIDKKKCGIHELFSGSLEGGNNNNSSSRTLVEVANSVMLPTHPCFAVDHITSKEFCMFKSAKMPMKVLFSLQSDCKKHSKSISTAAGGGGSSSGGGGCGYLKKDVSHTGPPESTEGEPGPCFVPLALSLSEVGIIFKSGDDVRQDQMVVQLLQLMDDKLRQDGLDLCLSPYRVLATGTGEGLVELVPHVVTFQSVQRDIAGYIRTHNPTDELYGAAMNRFTRSFAGYCVFSFILGIGDRHLENILMANDGRLLHIDFGYILGNDPKPFPPPMKINKEMVETLGGPQSKRYMEFKSYCCSSYNIIRKHAPLILSMLLLMVDASIPQISGDGKLDPRVNLLKVQDKLRLDLSNAQAAQYIQNVIADSVGSIFTNLWDAIHVATQATRH